MKALDTLTDHDWFNAIADARMEDPTGGLDDDQILARGTAFLDVLLGEDWVQFIDPEQLRMSEPDSCLLGQLFKGKSIYSGYSYALDKVAEEVPRASAIIGEMAWNTACGFELNQDPNGRTYTELQALWLDHIQTLREQRPA